MRVRNFKLKHQLILLIGIGIFVLILVQVLYYLNFNRVTIGKATVYAQNTIRQMDAKMNGIVQSIEKVSYAVGYNQIVQNYLVSEDERGQAAAGKNAESLMVSVIELNPYVAGIGLLDNEGELVLSSDYSEFGSYLFDRLSREFIKSDAEKPFFTPMLKVYFDGSMKYYYCHVSPVFSIIPDSNIKTKIGECILVCRPQALEDYAASTPVSDSSLFCIIDGRDMVVVSNNKNIARGDTFEINTYMQKIHGNRAGSVDGQVISLVSPVKGMDWKVAGIIPVYELTSELRDIRGAGILISVFAVLLLTAVGWIFIRSVTGPIMQIVNVVRKIGEKNIKQRINVNVTNELDVIADSINQMLDNIEKMTGSIFSMQTKLYEAEINKKEAELMALQSQINPHFLYNTLECIRSMGLSNNVMEIAEITTAMARIFRYSIKGDHFTQVREEIKCMTDYMKIISFRYMDKISYTINVDQRLLDMKIVKMILQPILENSVCHGLESKYGKGCVAVEGVLLDNSIRFRITDDGVGMGAQELETLVLRIEAVADRPEENFKNSRSIGLVNINNRIRMYYGQQYGIRIKSRENEGTEVVVELPAKECLKNVPEEGEG